MCPGGNLTLTCYTNGTELRWSITFPYHYLPEIRIISSIGPVDSQTPLFENPTLFQFLRTSRVPLMSTMLIDNITANLNMTRVDCWFDEGWSTIVIDVIGNGRLSFILHTCVCNPHMSLYVHIHESKVISIIIKLLHGSLL